MPYRIDEGFPRVRGWYPTRIIYAHRPLRVVRYTRASELRFTHMGTLVTPLSILSARFFGRGKKMTYLDDSPANPSLSPIRTGVGITLANYTNRIDASNIIRDLHLFNISQTHLTRCFSGIRILDL